MCSQFGLRGIKFFFFAIFSIAYPLLFVSVQDRHWFHQKGRDSAVADQILSTEGHNVSLMFDKLNCICSQAKHCRQVYLPNCMLFLYYISICRCHGTKLRLEIGVDLGKVTSAR